MLKLPKYRECGNMLLDRIPPDEFDRMQPRLQRIKLVLRHVIQEFNAEVTQVYFPTTGLASLLTVLEEDDPVEVATVGREGFVGISVVLGISPSSHRVICQLPGEAYRLPADRFREALERGPEISKLFGRYVGFVLRNASQTIACNALHTVEARASRWILVVHDQAGQDEFAMTHEFMAYMLGVRRQTVTVVVGSLQTAGLIRTRRGFLNVVDRPALEDSACECYVAIRDYYKNIIG